MKTRNLLTGIAVGLVLIDVTALLAYPIQDPQIQGQARPGIHYAVRIHNGQQLGGVIYCNYFVVLTDGAGNPVAMPQVFQYGVWTYNFYERGPITGTRVSHLTRHPVVVCPNTYSFSADRRTGNFYNGMSYLFNMEPIAYWSREQ